MRTVLSLAGKVLRLLGSSYGFWPGAIILLFAHGMNGRATDALPSLFGWGLVCGMAYAVRRMFLRSDFARAELPKELTLPPAKLAISVAPHVEEADILTLPEMIERLPAPLKALLRQP